MDERPFFTFSMDSIRPGDARTIEKFTKGAFDIDNIVREAGNLKTQSLLRKELEREMADPSDDLVKLLAPRVHEGRVTAQVRDSFGKMIAATFSAIVRDSVNDRLSSALNATSPLQVPMKRRGQRLTARTLS